MRRPISILTVLEEGRQRRGTTRPPDRAEWKPPVKLVAAQKLDAIQRPFVRRWTTVVRSEPADAGFVLVK